MKKKYFGAAEFGKTINSINTKGILMKKKHFALSFCLLISVFAVKAEKIIPENGGFEKWEQLSEAPAGWTLNKNEFPLNWHPVSSPKTKNLLIKKKNSKNSPLGNYSVYLNGNILSNKYPGFYHANINVSFKAKGEAGKLKVYLREFKNMKSGNIDYIALLMDKETTPEWTEYSFNVSMVPFHGADVIQIYMEGEGVLIDDFKVEKLENRAQKDKNLDKKYICAIPLSEKPPTVDGKYTPEEWANSVHYANAFININSGVAISRQSECLISSDGKNLLFCMISPIPNGGLKTTMSKRDDKIYMDESVEFFFKADYPKNEHNTFYQIITNFRGAVLDIKHGLGQINSGWNCEGLKIKRGSYKSCAILEISIPLKSLDIGESQTFGFNVCRNLRYPDEYANLTGGSYTNVNFMVLGRIDKKSPAVYWGYGGKTTDGKYLLDATIANYSNAKATFKSLLKTGPIVKKEKSRNFDLGNGCSGKIELNLSDEKISEGYFECMVADANNNIFFKDEIPFKTSDFYKVRKAFSEEKDVKLEFYPFQKKVAARILRVPKNEQKNYGNATIFISNDKGYNFQKTLEKPFFAEETGYVTAPFNPPENGFYTVRALLQDKDGEIIALSSRVVEKKNIPWLGNQIGKERVVIPPFTPLQYENDTISCWGRKYTIGKDGLPLSVESAGKQLLDAPVNFSIIGKEGKLEQEKADISFSEKAKDRAEFQSVVQYPGLQIKLNTWMEYDGCVFYKMDIIPEKELEITKFSLDIPLKKPKLLHAVADAIRNNSTYKRLENKSGILWASTDVKNRKIYGNFKPYIWLGTPESGFCWFGENDRGWVDDTKNPCIEVVRKNGKVKLVLNFISGPYKLKNDRHIEFGLMATPVKPRLTGVGIRKDAAYFGSFGGFFNVGLLSLNENISKKLQICKNLHSKKKAACHVYTAGQEYPLGDPDFKYFIDEIKQAPENLYTLDLNSKKYLTRGDNSDNYISQVVSWQPERVDFNLHRIKHLMKRFGFRGVYLDNSYPSFDKNLQTKNCGYVRDDGIVQPGCNLIQCREYIKRCATLYFLGKMPKPSVSVHVTDAMVIPCFSFADAALAGEMNIPVNKDHMDVFPLEKCEIMLGTHWGLNPSMLTMLGYGDRAKEIKPTRTMLALFKLFDIYIYNSGCNSKILNVFNNIEKDFGTCSPNSRFVCYWEDDAKAVDYGKNDNIKSSFYVRPDKKALIYITNFAHTPQEVNLKLNFKKFGIDAGNLIDAETDKAIDKENGFYKIKIKERDFRALRYDKI